MLIKVLDNRRIFNFAMHNSKVTAENHMHEASDGTSKSQDRILRMLDIKNIHIVPEIHGQRSGTKMLP